MPSVARTVAQNPATHDLQTRRARLDALRARSRAAVQESGLYRHEVTFTPSPYVVCAAHPAPGRAAGKSRCIYGLADPDSAQLCYIGQSVDVVKRLAEHMHPGPWECPRKTRWVEDLKARQASPVLWFLDSVLARRADVWDVLYIQAARALGKPLCNEIERDLSTCTWDAGWDALEQAKQRTQERLMQGPCRDG